ncbi:MAG: response regulator [Nitrospirales bacterium]|nr:response regulator [Nitrospira sp.]MDR4501304.1 response regulator [Nitrospirales bacterium]
MSQSPIILIAEDDDGHAALIERNLQRSGGSRTYLRLKDGQEALDFLFRRGDGKVRIQHCPYILLLDLNLPKINGLEVLRQIKEHTELRKIPVTVFSTTDDPQEVQQCHDLGCSYYITKPTEPDGFIDVIARLGQLLHVVQVPQIHDY